MDGNGRWAKRKNADRIEGHRQGAEVALDIVKHAAEKGIPYLTLYAFSSENWRRPQEEVQGLMSMLYRKLLEEADELVRNGVRLRTIGVTSQLPAHVQGALAQVCEDTRNCTKLTVTLALSYGSRDEIVRACKKVVSEVYEGRISVGEVDEKLFASFLDTSFMPDPDIIIRTSGEKRLSNFLLWQSSYSEIFFVKTLWPEFSRQEFDEVLVEFASRERRFGGL